MSRTASSKLLPPPPPSSSNVSLATMTDKNKGAPTPLSIATSAQPQSLPSQLCNTAPLPAAPQRTTSDPLPSPSVPISIPSNKASTEQEQPKSAGYETKSVKFGFGKHAEDGDGRCGEREERRLVQPGDRRKTEVTKRRVSNEHVNVYTECGRHGDNWLFGGWGKVLGGRKEG